MRKGIILFLAIFFIWQLAYAQEDKVNSYAWDFGTVRQGENLKHDFIFQNQTKSALNIISINTSCGCTTAQSDKQFLEPGETTVINVSFNTRSYTGQVTQFIYLHTDNKDIEIIQFTIKAQVAKED